VKVLSRVFRGKFVAGLKQAFRQGDLRFPAKLQPLERPGAFRSFLRTLFRQDWVVYAKPPFGGPEHVLQYLARYTHRVAISNHRLVAFRDGKVTFRWKDYAHGSRGRLMTLSTEEFLRRFLLHVLPRGFVRIRFFGLLANRRRATLLPLCRTLLEDSSTRQVTTPLPSRNDKSSGSLCPRCGGPMLVIERLTAGQLLVELAGRVAITDTSYADFTLGVASVPHGTPATRVLASRNRRHRTSRNRCSARAGFPTVCVVRSTNVFDASADPSSTHSETPANHRIPIVCRVRRKRQRLTSNGPIESAPAPSYRALPRVDSGRGTSDRALPFLDDSVLYHSGLSDDFGRVAKKSNSCNKTYWIVTGVATSNHFSGFDPVDEVSRPSRCSSC
jgi:hypothetical protein